MTNTVLIKRSGTANSVPVAGNLQTGELAINYTDGNLFYKDNNNGVQLLTSNKFVSVTGNITGDNLNATGLSLSGNVVSNVNVTSNIAGGNIKTPGLISAAGNITGNYFIGNGSQLTGITTSAGSAITNGTSDVTVSANSNITANVSGTTIATFASTGEYVTGIISATGNVTGNYFIGDGSQLTGIVSSYGNANVAANLAAFGTNPISTSGNITGNYFIGDGSQLTGIVSSYGNANVAANLAVFGTNPISTSGNITAGNILGGSNVNATTHTGTTVSVTGNITGGNVNAAGLSLSGNVVSALNLTANVTTTANISGSYILGNGSQLTGLPVTYANANVAANLAAFGTNPISTGGNITGGNFYVPTTNTGLIGGVIGLTYAGYFNGTNQYLTVPNATVLAGAGNLTIEFWAYPMNSSGRCFIGGTDWELYMSGWEVRFVQQNSYGFNSGLNVTPDTWNHVVLSRDSFVSGTSGNWRIFVNGVMYTTASNGGSPLSSPSYLGIGISVDNGGTRNPFEGYLSNFRIVNGVGVYTSAFTPSTTPLTPNQLANVNGSPSAALTAGQTKLLTLQNSTIIDNSSQALTITNYNTVVTSTSSVLVTSAQGTLIYDGSTWQSTSIMVTGTLSATGNVTGNFFIGNGSQLTGLPATYGNANVAANLAAFGTNPISTTGNITGNYFIGNGSQLTGIAPSYGNANVAANLAAFGTNPVSTTGNITGGNLNAAGLSLSGNIVSAINLTSNIVTTANISGGYILGNGSQLTGIVSSYGNANVAANLAAFGTNPVSTSGNITAGNILGGANVNATTHTGTTVSVSGNVTGGNVNTNTVVGTATTIKSTGDLTLSTTGNIVVGTYINGLSTPVQDQDAATKAYVDSVAQGLHVHDSANLASTADLATYTGATVTYNNGSSGVGATLSLVGNTLTTLDGVSIPAPASTRLLIKNQANAVQNGMYNYTSSSLLTRSTDFDTSAEAAGGDFLFVTSGATLADTGWVQTTDNPTLGTSPIVFTQFSGAGTFSANTSAGLVLNGTVFSAKTDNISTAFDGTGNIVVKASAQLTTPDIGAATGTSVSVTGNINGGNVIITGVLVDTTGNLELQSTATNGNINLTPSGTGIVAIATTLSVTGNITGGNILGGANVNATTHTGTTVSVTGNITGGNILGGANVNATTLTGITVSVTGNITGGNILGGANVNATTLTGTTVSVTGNITGGNILGGANVNATTLTGATVSITGNIITGGGIVSRSVSIADGTSVTINADTTDLATQTNTQVAGTLTINAPTGTLTNGQKIMFRLQSSNVQTFSWNAVFAGSTDLSLPTVSSGSSKYDYVGFIYNTTAAKWQILAKNFGF